MSSGGRFWARTGQEILAAEAKDLGIMNEVLPSGRLMDRALQLAHELAGLNRLTLRYSRVALTRRLKRLIDD